MRRCRQWIAALVVFGWAFAQAVTVAHACSMLAPKSQVPAQANTSAGQTMPADCAEMAKQSDSTVNVCASHCDLGQQVDVHADAPTPAIAPQPPLFIRPVGSAIPASSDNLSLLVSLAAPPLQLLFGRFLI